jgi:hypothetical protein
MEIERGAERSFVPLPVRQGGSGVEPGLSVVARILMKQLQARQPWSGVRTDQGRLVTVSLSESSTIATGANARSSVRD